MRTDGHDEANSRFSYFTNAPKNKTCCETMCTLGALGAPGVRGPWVGCPCPRPFNHLNVDSSHLYID